jgi:hypothetical protein
MCFLKFDSEESKKKLRSSAAMRLKTAERWGLGYVAIAWQCPLRKTA